MDGGLFDMSIPLKNGAPPNTPKTNSTSTHEGTSSVTSTSTPVKPISSTSAPLEAKKTTQTVSNEFKPTVKPSAPVPAGNISLAETTARTMPSNHIQNNTAKSMVDMKPFKTSEPIKKSEVKSAAPIAPVVPAAPKTKPSQVDSDSDDDIPLSAFAGSRKSLSNGSSKTSLAVSKERKPDIKTEVRSPAPKSESTATKVKLEKKESKPSTKKVEKPLKSEKVSKRRADNLDEKPSKKSKESNNTTESTSNGRKTFDIATTSTGARQLDKSADLKDQAVEAILVRWQYCTELSEKWPGPQLTSWGPDSVVDDGHVPLHGFPGVSIGVHADVCGNLKDTRPLRPRPSKAYLMTVPSEKLASMWKQALEKQLQVLIEHEGDDSQLCKALRDEVSTAEKFGRLAEKADRKAAKDIKNYEDMLAKAEALQKAALAEQNETD